MKRIFTYLVFFACIYSSSAQSVLYSNSFDSPGSFTLDPAGSFNSWIVNNVYQGGTLFTGPVIPNVPTQPASFTNPNQNYLHPTSPLALTMTFQPVLNANYVAGSGFSNIRAVMSTSVDATDFTDVTLSFWRVGGLNGMKVIYSLDGGTSWQDAGLSFQGSPTVWTEETLVINALDGQSNVRIGFEMIEAQLADPAPNPYHSIDEIKITGTPEPSGEIATTIVLPTLAFCSGQTVTANFQVSNSATSGANQYILELSDANGNFSNSTVIGTLNSTQLTGTINGVIPMGITGNSFRLRVNSTAPAIIGADNGTDFAIVESPDAPVITLNSATGQLEVSTFALSYEWFFFSDPIPNSQNQPAITPLMNGNYTVVASNGTCQKTSDFFLVNFVSIAEENVSNVQVFPNPISSLLHLSYDKTTVQEIFVTDISGKIVFQSHEHIDSISFENLNSGLYFVQFSGSKLEMIKVIKQ